MHAKIIAAVFAASLLPGCAGVEGLFNTTAPGAQPGRCVAAGAQSVLGKTTEARVISEAILGAGAARSRVIRPGDRVTTDVDPLRLNIEVDEANRITRLRCG